MTPISSFFCPIDNMLKKDIMSAIPIWLIIQVFDVTDASIFRDSSMTIPDYLRSYCEHEIEF